MAYKILFDDGRFKSEIRGFRSYASAYSTALSLMEGLEGAETKYIFAFDQKERNAPNVPMDPVDLLGSRGITVVPVLP